MTDVLEQLQGQRNEDLAKKAKEMPLTPEGRYKFQVESVIVRLGDREYWDKEETRKNPFYGKQMARLALRLSSKRDGKEKDAGWITLERPLLHFINVCPDAVCDDKGNLMIESKLFGQMSDVAGKAGATTNMQVIEYFKEHFGEINIGLSEANVEKGYEAKNWNRSIKGV